LFCHINPMERLQKNNFKFSKELLAPKILRLIYKRLLI
jgi:hypothetical protein